MTTIASTSASTLGYNVSNMIQQVSGSTSGAIAGTTNSSTLSGIAGMLQSTSGASSGMLGAISGTAAASTTVNIFSALGANSSIQSILKEHQTSKSVNPNLGNNLNVTV